MAVRVVCRACGKRLKFPDGLDQKRSAKCPKCLARVDLTAALEASVYMPTVSVAVTPIQPNRDTERKPTPPSTAKSKDDRLPNPVNRREPATAPPPLPASRAKPTTPSTATKPQTLSLDEQPLSLDDDPAPAEAPEAVPFRVPVRVLADSLRQVAGSCFAVLVPHGVFLEVEPLKPFLYIPLGCAAESLAPGELTITLPDARAVTLRIESRYARPLARDTLAFLAGERSVPAAADYRRKWWMLWLAVILALGLAGGPLMLSQTAELGWEFGLKVGGAFALVGLFANSMVVFFSRWPVPGQVAVMALVCVLVTGIGFFGATAYLAGRQKAIEQTKTPVADTPIVQPPVAHAPGSPDALNKPGPLRPPSHVDRAYLNGVSTLEDGPAEVTALTIAPDGNHLGIGYADGTTRIWPLDQPTFDAMMPGPKADGPVSRVQFDSTSRFMFATTSTGVIASPRNGSPTAPAKIPGAFVAVAPELSSDRVRFAAIRGNTVQHRFLSTTFVANPPKAKGFALPGKGDEVIPAANSPDPAKPAGPTFFAWTPGTRLLAGSPDGAVTVWSSVMKLETVNRDHKAPVKAWADCPGTGDFATGDDKGNIAIWPYKGGKPTLAPVFTTPVAGLSFSPSGAWLAVADNAGWLAVYDIADAKVIHRVKRPTPVKALAFGPYDDVMILANGKTVEVWWLPELVK